MPGLAVSCKSLYEDLGWRGGVGSLTALAKAPEVVKAALPGRAAVPGNPSTLRCLTLMRFATPALRDYLTIGSWLPPRSSFV